MEPSGKKLRNLKHNFEKWKNKNKNKIFIERRTDYKQ